MRAVAEHTRLRLPSIIALVQHVKILEALEALEALEVLASAAGMCISAQHGFTFAEYPPCSVARNTCSI